MYYQTVGINESRQQLRSGLDYSGVDNFETGAGYECIEAK